MRGRNGICGLGERHMRRAREDAGRRSLQAEATNRAILARPPARQAGRGLGRYRPQVCGNPCATDCGSRLTPPMFDPRAPWTPRYDRRANMSAGIRGEARATPCAMCQSSPSALQPLIVDPRLCDGRPTSAADRFTPSAPLVAAGLVTRHRCLRLRHVATCPPSRHTPPAALRNAASRGHYEDCERNTRGQHFSAVHLSWCPEAAGVSGPAAAG